MTQEGHGEEQLDQEDHGEEELRQLVCRLKISKIWCLDPTSFVMTTHACEQSAGEQTREHKIQSLQTEHADIERTVQSLQYFGLR